MMNVTSGKFAYKALTFFLFLFFILVNPKTPFAQNEEKKIQGVVVDEERNPLIGATIINLRTSSGANSDSKGNFSISVKEGDKLGSLLCGFKLADNHLFRPGKLAVCINRRG